ncbi:unnamed protein product [Ascophyllum nodosum]
MAARGAAQYAMVCGRATSTSLRFTQKAATGIAVRLHPPSTALKALVLPTVSRARELSFSFPGPRKLGDITNLPLLEKEATDQISSIWTAYHDKRADSVGTVMPGEALLDLQTRARKCPMFILPVWRESGHFMMLSQYQDTCFLLTFLEDYKVNPSGAQPYATISMYEDLVKSKGLGLLRADLTPNLTKKEVERLLRLLIRFYSPHAYHYVEAFNHRPGEFNLENFLQETPRD